MTTIINTPGNRDASDSSLGLIIGIIVAIGLVILFIVYGLPALRRNGTTGSQTNISVTAPSVGNPAPSSTTYP